MSYPADIDVVFNNDDAFEVELGTEQEFHCDMGEGFISDVYHGPTDITPSNEPQVLSTQGKVVSEDIIIEPIPSNYGLITWNGSTLVVS